MGIVSKTKVTDKESHYIINVIGIIHVLFINFFIILMVSVIGAGIAFRYATTQLTPRYTAKFTAYINNNNGSNSVQSLSSNDTAARQSLTHTYAEIIRSRKVIDAALRNSSLAFYNYDSVSGAISSNAQEETQIIEVKVGMNTPQEAYELAKSLASISPAYMTDIIEGSSMKIVEEPVLPVMHGYPNVGKITLLGAIIGGVLSSALVLLLSLLDKKVSKPEEIEQQLNYRVIGVIPEIKRYD